jgi:hypothetical protein
MPSLVQQQCHWKWSMSMLATGLEANCQASIPRVDIEFESAGFSPASGLHVIKHALSPNALRPSRIELDD